MQTMLTVFNSYERVETALRVVRRFGTPGAFIYDRRQHNENQDEY